MEIIEIYDINVKKDNSIQKKNICFKVFCVLFLILIVCLCVILTNYFAYYSRKHSEDKNQLIQKLSSITASIEYNQTCQTKSCIKAANRILSYIDTSIKPCDDFYKFSCGNFFKTKKINDDKAYSVSTNTILINQIDELISVELDKEPGPKELTAIKKAKILYKSCIEEIKENENSTNKNISAKSILDNLFENMMENIYLELNINETSTNIENDSEYSKSISLLQPITSCSTLVTSLMPYAVGRIYINLLSNKQLKKDVNNIVFNIKNEYISSIRSLYWIDSISEVNSIEKIETIDFKIAYPDFILNDTYLNNFYKDFDFKRNNLTHNSIILKEKTREYFQILLMKNNTQDDWPFLLSPLTVNGFYEILKNRIVIPAGILNDPYYDIFNPNYLNYAGLGFLLGHEISHGFFPKISEFDFMLAKIYNKLLNRPRIKQEEDWTYNTIEKFYKVYKCFTEQYSNLFVKQINESVSGDRTIHENLADNFGLKIAYNSYQKLIKNNKVEQLLPGLSYNQNQLFFINYAQTFCRKYTDKILKELNQKDSHSYDESRVNIPLRNFNQFEKTFNCKPDTISDTCSL